MSKRARDPKAEKAMQDKSKPTKKAKKTEDEDDEVRYSGEEDEEE